MTRQASPSSSTATTGGKRLNTDVEGFECDAVWPVQKVVVELDGREFHDDDERFETDRERDRVLQAAGFAPIRVTWRALDTRPDDLEHDLSALLRRRTL